MSVARNRNHVIAKAIKRECANKLKQERLNQKPKESYPINSRGYPPK